MPTRNDRIAQLALLSGDKTLAPLADLLGQQDVAQLNRDKFDFSRRQPTHLGSGFLYDPTTGSVTQDPAFAEFERQKHRDDLELYEVRDASQFQREVRAADRARERTVDTGTTRLSSALAKANIPELERGIEAIDDELAPYLERGKDLPGMGGIFNKLPGLTSDARGMKARVARVRNMILKARSGGAVTPQEADRLLEEFGLGLFNTDEDFLKSWADFKNAVDAGAQNIMAGFDDDVIDRYGRNLTRGEAPSPAKTPSNDVVDWGDLK